MPRVPTDPHGLSGAKVAAMVALIVTENGLRIDIDVALIGPRETGLEADIGEKLRAPATELGHAFAGILRDVHAERTGAAPRRPPTDRSGPRRMPDHR
jgi:hypothetical protein